ncbi:MAG TPA: hypothetical protein VJR05_05020 [Acidimicrobiia bacterium]|nr:hypothetical protein [Acidimicrobiia bacterium]
MDVAAAVVAFVFGVLVGLGLGRYWSERRVVMLSMAITLIIGGATWLVDPVHVAGPSLTIGGAALLLGAAVTPRLRSS